MLSPAASRLTVTHCGVEAFKRADNQEACPFRLTQDGAGTLSAYVTRRVVALQPVLLVRLLRTASGGVPLEELPEEVRTYLAALSEGSVLVVPRADSDADLALLPDALRALPRELLWCALPPLPLPVRAGGGDADSITPAAGTTALWPRGAVSARWQLSQTRRTLACSVRCWGQRRLTMPALQVLRMRCSRAARRAAGRTLRAVLTRSARERLAARAHAMTTTRNTCATASNARRTLPRSSRSSSCITHAAK